MTNKDQPIEVPGQTSIMDIEPLAYARTTDPETSHAAASSISSDAIRKSQQIVLDHLAAHGPMSDTQLVHNLTTWSLELMSPSGIRTRRRELTDLGFVEDSGGRVTLQSGRKAIVWAAS